MKKILIIGVLILLYSSIFSQINIKDSTAQAIGYWYKGEKQT